MKDDDKVISKDPRTKQEVKRAVTAYDGMPLRDFANKAQRFQNTDNHVYYDNAVYAAGAAILLGKKALLFTKGIGEADKILNTLAAYEKKELHTNMIEGGEFDNSTSFILEMIAVKINLSADAHAQVNGEIQTPAIAAVATYSPVNHIMAIRNQFKLTFLIGEQEICSGKLSEFPDPFVMSGAFGASAGGFVQNGFSLPNYNKLKKAYALRSKDKFSVVIEPLGDTFTPQQAFSIEACLFGQRIRNYR